jgi:hypothetical protein
MNIHLSQIILIGILTFFILYIFWLRTVWMDRIIYLLFAAMGILLVIDPNLTSQIASRIGIGRGTDLLIYLFILASLFYAVNIRAQLKRLREQMTLVVRKQALQQPLYGPIPPQDDAKINKQ